MSTTTRLKTNQSGILVDRVRVRGNVGNSGGSLDRSSWPCAEESGVPAGPFGEKPSAKHWRPAKQKK
jgi:hypothetical protein